jgi:hypothetical protein
MTGKAFRHELKRLFISIAIKMHLTKDTVQKPTDRRTTTININYLVGNTNLDQRSKDRRSLPSTLPLVQCRQSIDSTTSTSIRRHFQEQQQQQLVRHNMNDVTYCYQRISNV